MHVVKNLEARYSLAVELGFPQKDTPQASELCSEAMRSAVWATTNGGREPVFTTSLLNRFAALVPPDWRPDMSGTNDNEVNPARAILDDLQTLGDVEALGSGYWLPTPLRLVRTTSLPRLLLVGGRPTALTSLEVREQIKWNGSARFLNAANSDPGQTALPVQDLASWAGMPDTPLLEWTAEIFASAAMKPFDDSTRFEVYAPSMAARTTIQYKRWKILSDKIPDGMYLAKQLGGMLSHFAIVQVRRGEVVGSAAVPGRLDVRRLMYGVDALNGVPAQFKIRREHGETIVFVSSEIPKAERRLCFAFGRLRAATTTWYPRMWAFRAEVIDEIFDALKRLGVRMVSKPLTL